MSDVHDCVVVGGGAAGLSAALVLGRARRRTLVADAGRQSNRVASHVGGFLGHDGTPPPELYARAREQLAAYGSVELREATVAGAQADGETFRVALGDSELAARTLIIASGMEYELPEIPGVRDLWGRAVFHCPFCEGWELRERRVAVIASQEADHQITLLAAWTDDVVRLDPADVAALSTDDRGGFRGVALRDGHELRCDAVFVQPQLRLRAAGLAAALGLELTDDGRIAVDELQRTSVPGVYAAGDAAMPMQQVAIAAGSGHVAGVMVVRELLFGR